MLNYRQLDDYRSRKNITQIEIALLYTSETTGKHVTKNYINQLLNGAKPINQTIYEKLINIINNPSIHELAKEVKLLDAKSDK